MKNNTTPESKFLIDQLSANTTELLNLYWKQAETLALGTDELKVGIIHSIKAAPKGGFAAKSTLSFGRRVKAAVEHVVDPDQGKMAFMDEKPAKAAPARKRNTVPQGQDQLA
jgi:hypothetical protein